MHPAVSSAATSCQLPCLSLTPAPGPHALRQSKMLHIINSRHWGLSPSSEVWIGVKYVRPSICCALQCRLLIQARLVLSRNQGTQNADFFPCKDAIATENANVECLNQLLRAACPNSRHFPHLRPWQASIVKCDLWIVCTADVHWQALCLCRPLGCVSGAGTQRIGAATRVKHHLAAASAA